MKKTILLCSGLLLAAAAQAQFSTTEAGPYVLVAGGQSDYDADCSGLQSCDKTDSAFKVIGGYRFSRGWAVEAVALDFGKTTAALGTNSADVKVRAIGGGVALHADLGPRLGATVRVGMANVRAEGTGRVGNTVVLSESDSSMEAYAGVGLAFSFTKNMAIEAGWDSTRGELDGDGGRVSAFSLGVKFSF
jgi:opacity protein-like surface antigen